jgi:hypothetical protein
MLPEAAPVARALAYNFFHDLYFKEADVMSASLFYKKIKKCLFAYGQDLKTKGRFRPKNRFNNHPLQSVFFPHRSFHKQMPDHQKIQSSCGYYQRYHTILNAPFSEKFVILLW